MQKGLLITIIVVAVAIIAVVGFVFLSGDGFSIGESGSNSDPLGLKTASQESAIQTIAQSNNDVNSYDLDTTIDMFMDINFGEQFQISLTSESELSGNVDRVNQEMHLSGYTTYEVPDENGDQESVTEEYELNIVDGEVTLLEGDEITTQELDPELWNQYEILTAMTNLLETSEIEFLPDENYAGESHYVLNVDINFEDYYEDQDDNYGTDLSQFEEFIEQFDTKFWIDKDNGHVKKIEVTMKTDSEELTVDLKIIFEVSNIS